MKTTSILTGAFICLSISFLFSCSKASQGYYGNYVGTTDSTRIGLADTTIADTFNISPGSTYNLTIMQQRTGLIYNASISGTALTIPVQNTLLNGYAISYSGTGTLTGNTLTLSMNSNQSGDSTKIKFQGTQVKQ